MGIAAHRGRLSGYALATLLLVAVIVVAPASGAHAWAPYPCKYSRNLVWVTFSTVPAKYKTGVTDAMARWNAAQSDIRFTTTEPLNTPRARLSVHTTTTYGPDVFAAVPYQGMCSNGNSGTWTSNVALLYWNTPASGASEEILTTSERRRKVAAHEMGHALGLAHVGTSPASCSPISVMRQGTVKWTCGWGLEPHKDDVDGAKSLY